MYFGFENISIAFDNKTILEDINIEFPREKASCIIGANGCGKSSLLKTITKTVKPKTGRVIYNDKPLKSYSVKDIAKKIGFLPQVRNSPPDIDVRTLVSYGRYPYKKLGQGLSRKDRKVIDKSLEKTGIKHLQSRNLGNLSGGERQRAWIAMILCQEPEIMILDEPITYLDIGYQIEVMELIKDLVEEEKITVIMVLHDINLAARYSDMIFSIKNKTIEESGSAKEVLNREEILKIYNIDSRIIIDEKYDKPIIIPEKRKDDKIEENI